MEGMSAFPSDRFAMPPTRVLVRALAGATAAALTVSLAPAATSAPAGAGDPTWSQKWSTDDGPLRLGKAEGGVRATSVPLDSDLLARRMPTGTFTMVAVTWQDADVEPEDIEAGDIEVRVRQDGRWQQPLELTPLEDGPDLSESLVDDTIGRQGAPRLGTELAWVGEAEGVQVDLGIDGDELPDGLQLELIDARPLASDRPMTQWRAPRDDGSAPRPDILTRKQWGANPDWRDGTLRINKTIKQVHVHHTATGNDYRRADVPGILRGIYRYHTKTLHWADIGYNFLIDRFGRTWMGRAGGKGGAAKPVQGAHTLGFNKNSTGVAVLGNFESKRPPARVITSIVALAAWKLDAYDRDPTGKIRVRSTGSDLYDDGEVVRLPVIDGHRDTNQTACPGRKLYKRLPEIRRLTKKRINAF